MTHAYIKLIEFYLPEKIETNDDLIKENPDWNIQKISSKTGIKQRHIAAIDETSLVKKTQKQKMKLIISYFAHNLQIISCPPQRV